MADLIKTVPLVKVATIRRKDLRQISFCSGLRDDEGGLYQKMAAGDRRELAVIGWLVDGAGNKRVLVQRDDGRLLQQILYHDLGTWVAEHYPQLFVR